MATGGKKIGGINKYSTFGNTNTSESQDVQTSSSQERADAKVIEPQDVQGSKRLEGINTEAIESQDVQTSSNQERADAKVIEPQDVQGSKRVLRDPEREAGRQTVYLTVQQRRALKMLVAFEDRDISSIMADAFDQYWKRSPHYGAISAFLSTQKETKR